MLALARSLALLEAPTAPPSPHELQAGLTTHEAELRLRQDGPNEPRREEPTPCLHFLSFFWGPMPFMMWLAIAVEASESPWGLEHCCDLCALLLLQAANGLVAWNEERSAAEAVAGLRRELEHRATVKRDGLWVELPARLLSRGDVIRLQPGCLVPADCDLLAPHAAPQGLAATALQVDQTALTGDVVPKTVPAGARVFQGTTVLAGEMDAMVADTGPRTFFGRAAALGDPARGAAASAALLAGRAGRVARSLTLALLLAALLLVAALAVRLLASGAGASQVLSLSAVLLVASVPVAAQVVFTSSIAAGVHGLARSGVLLRRLSSLDDLAAVDVVCVGKAGTLTTNQLSVSSSGLTLDPNFGEDALVLLAALPSVPSPGRGAGRTEDAVGGRRSHDALDRCLTSEVSRRGLGEALSDFRVLRLSPSDPDRGSYRPCEALVQVPGDMPRSEAGARLLPEDWCGTQVAVMRGAPQAVLPLCEDAERVHDKVAQAVTDLALRGFGALAVAAAAAPSPPSQPPTASAAPTSSAGSRSGGLGDFAGGRSSAGAAPPPALAGSCARAHGAAAPAWSFLGLLAVADPLRGDSAAAIRELRALGVEVKMLTGDQLAISKAVGRAVGLGGPVQRADLLDLLAEGSVGALEEPSQGLQEADLVDAAGGFAEVAARHKLRVVQALQRRGRRVCYVGGGLDDVPALKAADVAAAAAGAVDAARAVSDLLMSAEGLGSVLEAVAGARAVSERLRTYCLHRIAFTTNLLLSLFFPIMFISPTAVNPQAVSPPVFQLPVFCLVLIALLNNGCVLTIPYDRVPRTSSPSTWHLWEVALVAVTMGAMSCFASVLLLIAGVEVMTSETSFCRGFWHGALGLPVLNFSQLQTMLHLAVSVLAFLGLFASRARGPFPAAGPPPGAPLLVACLFALAASTAFAHTDFVRAASGASESSGLPSGVLLAVWAYCLVWLALEDVAKSLLLRHLRRHAADAAAPAGGTSAFDAAGVLVSEASLAGRCRSIAAAVLQAAATGGAERAEGARQWASELEEASSTQAVVGASSLLSRTSLLSRGSLPPECWTPAAPSGPRPSATGSGKAVSIARASTAAGSPRTSDLSRPSDLSLWSGGRASDPAATSPARAATAAPTAQAAAPAAAEAPAPAGPLEPGEAPRG